MKNKTLSIDRQEVQVALIAAGYNPQDCGFEDQRLRKSPKQYIHMFTSNGIRCEIAVGKFLFANYKQDAKIQELVKNSLCSKGYPATRGKAGNGYVRVEYSHELTSDQIINLFTGALLVIEEINGITKGNRNYPLFNTFTNIDDEINASVEMFLTAVSVGSQRQLNRFRDLLSADDMDVLITRGQSTNYRKNNSWREHIVPVIVIFNEMKRMHSAGESKAAIAKMLKDNLIIVLISNEEQQLLDIGLQLRTTMPEGWEFGQTPYARLEFAGINIANT